MGWHDSRSELPSHTPGTPKGEELLSKYGREPGATGTGDPTHGTGLDEHQSCGPRPDRPADAPHAAAMRPGPS